MMPDEVKKQLPRLYSQDHKDPKDIPIVVKYFTPDANATWYITEGDEQPDGDWMLFGLCDLGLGFPELGNVMLSEIQGVRGRLGLKVERDLHFNGKMLGDVL